MDDGDLLIRNLSCKYILFSPRARMSHTWNQHLISHLINHRFQHLRWAAASGEREVLAITVPSHPFTFQIDGIVTEMALGAACQSSTLSPPLSRTSARLSSELDARERNSAARSGDALSVAVFASHFWNITSTQYNHDCQEFSLNAVKCRG